MREFNQLYRIRGVGRKTGESLDLWIAHKGPTWTSNPRKAHTFVRKNQSWEELNQELERFVYNTKDVKLVTESL